MFDKEKLAHAVDLQAKAYALLLWVSASLDKGGVSFGAMHQYAAVTDAAQEWIERHYDNIPQRAKPMLEDLPTFCKMFTTFLQNSFELIENPGQRLFLTGAHCFCPMCSWLVNAPRLKTKQLSGEEKKTVSKRINNMMRNDLMRIAAENSIYLDKTAAQKLTDDKDLRSTIALSAYGSDLLHRLNGIANGPAVLGLWRRFAWAPNQAPQKSFKLTADMIIDAEDVLLKILQKEVKS